MRCLERNSTCIVGFDVPSGEADDRCEPWAGCDQSPMQDARALLVTHFPTHIDHVLVSSVLRFDSLLHHAPAFRSDYSALVASVSGQSSTWCASTSGGIDLLAPFRLITKVEQELRPHVELAVEVSCGVQAAQAVVEKHVEGGNEGRATPRTTARTTSASAVGGGAVSGPRPAEEVGRTKISALQEHCEGKCSAGAAEVLRRRHLILQALQSQELLMQRSDHRIWRWSVCYTLQVRAA